MPKLVCMLRVKDGMLFLQRWLDNIGSLVDEIVVVDNGSTDGTYETLQIHPKVVDLARTEGFNEGRDKILAYEMARKRKPDWCLWLDVDENYEDRVTRKKLEKMMRSKLIKKYYFRRFHLHCDEKHFEGSLQKIMAQSVPDRVLWKENIGGYFENLKIHNGLVRGIKGMSTISHLRIKHYGQIYREYLHRKTNTYIDVDPKRAEMYIKHRDQQLPVWKWYDFADNRVIVGLQNIVFDLLYIVQYLKRKLI